MIKIEIGKNLARTIRQKEIVKERKQKRLLKSHRVNLATMATYALELFKIVATITTTIAAPKGPTS